jgi:hypothetical protein
MPYIINRYDGTELTILEDSTVDTSTSLGLVGRNYFGYGETQNENFLFLLENFANSSPPQRPVRGQLWFNTESQQLNIYTQTSNTEFQWVVVGSAVISDTAPSNKSPGSFWLKSPGNVLYVWTGADWTFIGPETAEGFGTTRAVSTTLLDTSNVSHAVIIFYVDGKPQAICASESFTINQSNPQTGFSTLVQGITLSTSAKIKSNLEGVADSSIKLETPRLINGIAFDGTQNVIVKANTTWKLSSGQYLNGDDFDGSSPETWRVDATPSNTAGKVVARDNQGGFSAGVINATLVGNVIGNVNATSGESSFNIINANTFVGATLTGNSNTTTRLRTSRKINDVAFDGTADITVPASAQTLTGTFISSQVQVSNLTQVGKLINLSVADAGISVGDSTQKLKITSTNDSSSIYAESGILRIGTSSSPEISILNSSAAQSQGGPSGYSSVIPNGNSNLGLPAKKWDKVYANDFLGNASTASLADRATNLVGGGAGSIAYQSSSGNTTFLPVGTPGNFLRAGANNTLQWSSLAFERLNKGSFLNFEGLSGDVTFYDTQNPITLSVDASTTNQSGKIVARDASGNFSAGTITASLNGAASQNVLRSGDTMTNFLTLHADPVNSFHAATKRYVDNTLTPGRIRAWVTFNGINGNILSSFNVTSVNVTGSGKYQINIPNGILSNGNYAAAGMASDIDHLVTFNNASPTTLVVYTTDTHANSNNATSATGRVMVMIAGD